MIIRRLNINDIEQVSDLVNSRWNKVKLKRPDSEHNQTLIDRIVKRYGALSIGIEKQNNLSGLGQSLGAFDNNKNLISVVTQYFDSTRPSYYIGNMVVRVGLSNLYNVESMGLAKCIDYCVEFAETKNYFQWYWISETRGWNFREEQWYKNCYAFRRYHVFIDSMYGVGDQPIYQYQKNMVGNNGANAKLSIKMAVLKPELLHIHYKNKGLLKEDFVPLQYKELKDEEKYVGKRIKIEETTLENLMQYETLLKDDDVMLNPEQYLNNVKNGEHKYFCAYINKKLVGTIAMVKYISDETNELTIYHRCSWTHKDFRKQGIWNSLWTYKLNYINNNKWSGDNMTHIVAVTPGDKRYELIGWKLLKTIPPLKFHKEQHIFAQRWNYIKKTIKFIS